MVNKEKENFLNNRMNNIFLKLTVIIILNSERFNYYLAKSRIKLRAPIKMVE